MRTQPRCTSVHRLLAIKLHRHSRRQEKVEWKCTMEHIHLADIRFLHGHQWMVYKSPSLAALKPISPICACSNRAAPNANCITMYWFSFNDFVTPLTVLYKSRAGWFVQGPPLDKLVWLQCSAAPSVCVSLSLSLLCNVTHSAHSSVFLSLAGVEGKTGWLTDGLADERWQSHSMETCIETAFCWPTAVPLLHYQRTTLAVRLTRSCKRASAGIAAEMLL